MSTKSSVPEALSPVAAGQEATGLPCPTMTEMEQYLTFAPRFRTYMNAAAAAWVKEHGLPKGLSAHADMELEMDLEWPVGYRDATIIEFSYYSEWWEWRHGSKSVMTIPVKELLPEFGASIEMLVALGAPATLTPGTRP